MGPKNKPTSPPPDLGGGALNLETGEERAPRSPLPGPCPGPGPSAYGSPGPHPPQGSGPEEPWVLMARETRARGVGYAAEAALLFLISEPGTQPRVARLRSNAESRPTTATVAAGTSVSDQRGAAEPESKSAAARGPHSGLRFTGLAAPFL